MEQEQLQHAIFTHGICNISEHLEQSLESWKDVPLQIGVIGRSGVGKSCLINAIRGLSSEDDELSSEDDSQSLEDEGISEDDGLAKVGVTETTHKVTRYPHPKNNKLVLCDLPGVGTTTFPKETYFKDRRIGMDKFDVFLVLTSDRFMADDAWLVKGIKERGKGFIFTRTKLAQDLENEKKRRKAYFRKNPNAVNDVITKIRRKCEEDLRTYFPEDKGAQRVFLIDSYECNNPLYDFDSLIEQLIENVPALKRDALILSLPSITVNVIKEKERILRSRMWKCCARSAIGGAVPIPGVSLALDTGIVLSEVSFYREQLGLGTTDLTIVSNALGISIKDMKLTSIAITFTKTGIIKYASYLTASEVAEKALALTLPVIGSIAGACLSYASTRYVLQKILDCMLEDAQKVHDAIAKSSASTSFL